MNMNITIGFLLLVFTSSAFSQEGFEGRPITDNVWMPTGYTLNKGEFKIGQPRLRLWELELILRISTLTFLAKKSTLRSLPYHRL